MSQSSRPEIIHYSDLMSLQQESPVHTRYRHSDELERLDTIDKIEVQNHKLVKENRLLKKQLELKQENFQLHGMQIMADVIHLLDDHHIYCPQNKSVYPSAELKTQDSHESLGAKIASKAKHKHAHYLHDRSPYKRKLSKEHSILNKAYHRSQDLPDSEEIEDLLEESALISKPKYESTPCDRRYGKLNYNGNAHGNTPPVVRTLCEDTERLSDSSFALQSANDKYTSYFLSESEIQELNSKPVKKRSFINPKVKVLKHHLSCCKTPELHIPRKPTESTGIKVEKLQPKPRKPLVQREPHASPVDLNQKYTVNKQNKKSSHTPPKSKKSIDRATSVSPRQPTAKVSYTLPAAPINKLGLLEESGFRVLGEIAFQLDKRILSFVLNGKFQKNAKYKSFYGYNVVNLQQKILEREMGEDKEIMLERYKCLMRTLSALGYVVPYHGDAAVTFVNKYGVMKQSGRENKKVNVEYKDEGTLRNIVRKLAKADEVKDILVMLQCLAVMAADDGLPMFVW